VIAWRKPVAFGLATIAAPAAPALVLLALGMFVSPTRLSWSDWRMLALVFLIGLAHVVVLGLPIATWLHHLGRLRTMPIAIAGFIVGAVPVAVFYAAQNHGAWNGLFLVSALFAGCGVIAALAFLGIYRVIAGRDAMPVA